MLWLIINPSGWSFFRHWIVRLIHLFLLLLSHLLIHVLVNLLLGLVHIWGILRHLLSPWWGILLVVPMITLVIVHIVMGLVRVLSSISLARVLLHWHWPHFVGVSSSFRICGIPLVMRILPLHALAKWERRRVLGVILWVWWRSLPGPSSILFSAVRSMSMVGLTTGRVTILSSLRSLLACLVVKDVVL